MKIWYRFALVPALALVLGACDDDAVQPDMDEAKIGEVSFRFSGDRSGTFQARGALEGSATGQLRFGTYALGLVDSTNLVVEGFRAGTQPKGDAFIIALIDFRGPGTYPIGADDCDLGDDCSLMVFAMGFNIESSQVPPDRLYIVTSGSVVVTAANDERARGTFSGTGILFDIQTGDFGAELQISNGEFDVPLFKEDGSSSLANAGAAQSLLPLSGK